MVQVRVRSNKYPAFFISGNRNCENDQRKYEVIGLNNLFVLFSVLTKEFINNSGKFFEVCTI